MPATCAGLARHDSPRGRFTLWSEARFCRAWQILNAVDVYSLRPCWSADTNRPSRWEGGQPGMCLRLLRPLNRASCRLVLALDVRPSPQRSSV
eukprot:scaffold293_cov267-Prasinococcus_capsulatus_cf.AAC.3